MKNIFAFILLICISSIFLVSYTPNPTRNSYNSNSQIKQVALISTIIGKVLLPNKEFSGLAVAADADKFIRKAKILAPTIMEEETKSIDGYREIVASTLKDYLKCEVLFGQSLVNKLEYLALCKKFDFQESLNIAEDRFKKLIIPSDEKNMFQFSEGHVTDYMKDYWKCQKTMSEICTTLGTDLVAVSFSQLWVTDVSLHLEGIICLETHIFFYNPKGDLVATGTAQSDFVNIQGDDIQEYRQQLRKISSILGPMMDKAIKRLGKKGYL
jgi:hypothetical protein